MTAPRVSPAKQITMPVASWAALEAMARAWGLTRSEAVRRLIELARPVCPEGPPSTCAGPSRRCAPGL